MVDAVTHIFYYGEKRFKRTPTPETMVTAHGLHTINDPLPEALQPLKTEGPKEIRDTLNVRFQSLLYLINC